MSASVEAPGAPASAPDEAAASSRRETWFRIVLLGLVILVAGFTALLIGQETYPCVPGTGSTVGPPLGQCAVALSPWIVLVALGLVLAALGYLRVR